jgi:hypothetical protein
VNRTRKTNKIFSKERRCPNNNNEHTEIVALHANVKNYNVTYWETHTNSTYIGEM